MGDQRPPLGPQPEPRQLQAAPPEPYTQAFPYQLGHPGQQASALPGVPWSLSKVPAPLPLTACRPVPRQDTLGLGPGPAQ